MSEKLYRLEPSLLSASSQISVTFELLDIDRVLRGIVFPRLAPIAFTGKSD
jgi:hypothetical protein